MERSKSRRGQACLTGFFLVILVYCIGACVPQGRKPAAPLPRANPGYVQWLERQSMLAASPQYTRLVSGTELLWRAPTADKPAVRVNTLLEAADTWLFVQPQLLLTENQRPVLAELSANLRLLQSLGISGLYMQPTAESAALWAGQNTASTGEDTSSLSFASHVGTEKQYADLARLAGQQQLQLGSGLVPAAVGIGPDFFLAARHVREYPGTMMMVDIPKELWKLLPPADNVPLPTTTGRPAHGGAPASAPVPATGPWVATPLQGAYSACLTALAEKNILPPALLRDSLRWASPGGWAATPIIEGIDGVERRFVYRYHGNVSRALLQWDDPSRNAQRILSADIIRTIGSQQQTLGGLYAEAWAGLDSVAHDLQDLHDTATANTVDTNSSAARLPEPAASALRSLSREISRYGGWSMQADTFPPHLTAAILRTGVDFSTDNITSPLAEYALLTSDAQPLKQALKDSLSAGIDQRRLVRSLPHYQGLDLRSLQENPQGRKIFEKFKEYLQHLPSPEGKSSWAQQAPLHDSVLYATGASLAAMSAQISPDDAAHPESRAAIRARHLLLTSFRAGLPGLLLLSGQDLSGSFNLSPAESANPTGHTLGAWAFSAPAATALSTRTGHSRAPALYGPLSAQMAEPGSYLQQIAALTALRKQWGLARATLLTVPDTQHAETVAVLLQLPDGKHVLNIANFSSKSRSEQIALAAVKIGKSAANLLSPQQSVRLDGQTVRLELDPWQCSLIYIN